MTVWFISQQHIWISLSQKMDYLSDHMFEVKLSTSPDSWFSPPSLVWHCEFKEHRGGCCMYESSSPVNAHVFSWIGPPADFTFLFAAGYLPTVLSFWQFVTSKIESTSLSEVPKVDILTLFLQVRNQGWRSVNKGYEAYLSAFSFSVFYLWSFKTVNSTVFKAYLNPK